VLQTRDVLRASTHGSRMKELIPGVHASTGGSAPPAAALPPSTASVRIARMKQEGYSCFQGRWNPRFQGDDLHFYWKDASREVVVRFEVVEGAASDVYYLAGTVERDDDAFFGRVDRFEGPTDSASGIHRLFAVMGIEGQLKAGAVQGFRTSQDQAFTPLRPCEG
jgi:hypothetical protein